MAKKAGNLIKMEQQAMILFQEMAKKAGSLIKMKQKGSVLYFFTHFTMILIVFDHACACVCWSKYTTEG